MKRSMRRASFDDRYGATSNSFTSPAIWLESRDASKRVMRVMPGFPARALSQACWTVLPIGQTMPSPVTTTLRRVTQLPLTFRSRLGVRLDVVDSLLDGGDFLGFLVGNRGLELLLERHHQLYGVQRVRAQVIDERRLVLDFGLVDSELLGDDLLDTLFDVFHPRLLPLWAMPVRGSRGDRILRHIHAAVDVQHCSRDVAAAGRNEIGDGGGGVIRRAETPERNVLEQRLSLYVGKRARHIGVDEARRNAVHRDVAAAELAGERFRHAANSRLGGGVVG